MNAIEQKLEIGVKSEIIANPKNVEFIRTGKFFIGGNYHDNLDDIQRYKTLIRRNKD